MDIVNPYIIDVYGLRIGVTRFVSLQVNKDCTVFQTFIRGLLYFSTRVVTGC